ncbi:MAG: ABC transporter-related protein [Rhodospirillaceae bacterium]|nr:MAG: ABC transporter-related protein [Rhodospirillaceae bacterium]
MAILLVTNDPEEAMLMADRIELLGPDGRVHQSGTPEEIYFTPASPFVARFLGPLETLKGVATNGPDLGRSWARGTGPWAGRRAVGAGSSPA